ncbi:MAG: SBBP repeat-containing protein [Candidatus Brocadia sp.]|nr:SBBP repeat-containing protein [Candidatus Brocadia sp.]
MKMRSYLVVSLLFLLVVLYARNLTAGQVTATQHSKTEIMQMTKKLHMPFISNTGQVDERVKFYANTFGGTVFVTKGGEIGYSISKTERELENSKANGIQNSKPEARNTKPSKAVYFKEELIGGKTPEIKGEGESITRVNYFKGNDQSRWKTNIPTYEFVSLGEVYEGIEVKLKAYGNNVEKLFYVKQGAEPDDIRLRLKGNRFLRINKEGELVVKTALGDVKFSKPIAYQEIGGKRVEVEVEYSIQNPEVRDRNKDFQNQKSVNNNRTRTNKFVHATPMRNPKSAVRNPKSAYGFKVAAYDKTKELVIDPLLASTYLGGSGDDVNGIFYLNSIDSIAIDSGGNVYVTGSTASLDFPITPGAYDTSYGGTYDAFVAKLSGDLTKLLGFTYLGGSYQESGNSIAIDQGGNIYVSGSTASSDFPTTLDAYDTSYGGSGWDAFVSKLSGDLTILIASTYLGGSNNEDGNTVAIDSTGNIYVAGDTASSDFPITFGAYDTTHDNHDVFVSNFNSDLTSLLASTFLGGWPYDYGYSIAIDAGGNIYVTGELWSSGTSGFPTTLGAYDTSYEGGYNNVEAFVSKFNGTLTSLLASTFLGGSRNDKGYSIAIGSGGNIYVVGTTMSLDYPTTASAYDNSYNGGGGTEFGDVFISRLNSDLTSLLASTYLGGSAFFGDWASSVVIDSGGNVYVAGVTTAPDFPTTSSAYDTSYNGGDSDVFVSKFDSNLSDSSKVGLLDHFSFSTISSPQAVGVPFEVTITAKDAYGNTVTDFSTNVETHTL